jgi:23S rRNA-/tRNA-specific pseudouridylate synthase
MVRTVNYQRSRAAAAESLAEYLAKTFRYFDAERWRRVIRDDAWVSVDGMTCREPETPLPRQCRIALDVPERNEPAVDERMSVLHDDDAIAVVVKSGNMPVAEGGCFSKHTLVNIAPRVVRALAAHAPAGDDDDDGGEGGRPAASNGTAECSPFLCVHRLDKETSGIVVMAKTREAAARLGRQFAHATADDDDDGAQPEARPSPPCVRSRADEADTAPDAAAPPVEKEYTAVLLGELRAPLVDVRLRIAAEHELPPDVLAACFGAGAAPAAAEAAAATVAASPPTRERSLKKIRMCCVPDSAPSEFGRSARTVVVPVAIGRGVTLCRVRLYSGRTHQIRVHCAAIGFPLVGDKLYLARGATVDCATYLARVRGQSLVEHAVALTDGGGGESTAAASSPPSIVLRPTRHLLHASALRFTHPVTGERMGFASDAAAVFEQACPGLHRLLPAVAAPGVA